MSRSWGAGCEFSAILYLINLRSSFILSSFSFSYFYFSLSIISFFSSSIFFSLSSTSMAFTLSCHNFSVYFLYCSNPLIYYSNCWTISGVIVCIGFLFFALFWQFNSFCSSYFTLFCLMMYCSWFLRRIFYDYISFSFRLLPYYLIRCSSFFSSSILYSYYSSFFMIFNTLLWSCLIFNKLFFSSSKFYSSVFKYFSSSSLASKVRLL